MEACMVAGVEPSLEGPPDGPDALDRALKLLRQPATPDPSAIRRAEQLLERCLESGPTGDIHAALGLAQFLQEEYVEAAGSLRLACERQPANQHWKDLLGHAERFAIFLQAASRRLQTDPFYTTRYDAQHYTEAGLARIDEATLKDLLLRHYPALADSGLTAVNNAFEPWGSTADSAPSEHPLTVDAERYVTKHPGRRAGGTRA
jgi:hypothetical protein